MDSKAFGRDADRSCRNWTYEPIGPFTLLDLQLVSDDLRAAYDVGLNVIVTSDRLKKTSSSLRGHSSSVTEQNPHPLHHQHQQPDAVDSGLVELRSNYFCSSCNKQYNRQREFDNHLQSYDHAHQQRLKDLKTRELRRQIWNSRRRRRSRVRGDREVKRLLEFANKRAESVISKAKDIELKPSSSALPLPLLWQTVSEEGIPDSMQREEKDWREKSHSTNRTNGLLLRMDEENEVGSTLHLSSSFSSSSTAFSSFTHTHPLVVDAQPIGEAESAIETPFPATDAGNLLHELEIRVRRGETTINSVKVTRPTKRRRGRKCYEVIGVESMESRRDPSDLYQHIKRVHLIPKDGRIDGKRLSNEKSGRNTDDVEGDRIQKTRRRLNRRRHRPSKGQTVNRPRAWKTEDSAIKGCLDTVSHTTNQLLGQPEGSSLTGYYHSHKSVNNWSSRPEVSSDHSLQLWQVSSHVSTTCNKQRRHHQNTAENLMSGFFAPSGGRTSHTNNYCCTHLENRLTSRLAVTDCLIGESGTKLRRLDRGGSSGDLKGRPILRRSKWQKTQRNVEDDHPSTSEDVAGHTEERGHQRPSCSRELSETSAILEMVEGDMSSSESSLGFCAASQRMSNQVMSTSHVIDWKRQRMRKRKKTKKEEEEDVCVSERGASSSGTDCFQVIGPNDPLIFKRPSLIIDDRALNEVSCLTGTTGQGLNPVSSSAANHQCIAVYKTPVGDARDGGMVSRNALQHVSADRVFLCGRNVDVLKTSNWTGNRKTLTNRRLKGESVERLPLVLTMATADWRWVLASTMNTPTNTLSTALQLSLSSSPPPLVKPPGISTTYNSAFNHLTSLQDAIISRRPVFPGPAYFPDCPSKHPSVSWRLPVLSRSLRVASVERKRATMKTLFSTIARPRRPPLTSAVPLHCCRKPMADPGAPLFTGQLHHAIRFPTDAAGFVGCRPHSGAPSYEFIASTSSNSNSSRSIHPCHLGQPHCFRFYRRTEVRAFDRMFSQPYLMVVPLPVAFCMLTG